MTPTPWLLILVILVLLGCSTAPAIPTPTPEPVPRRVSFDNSSVRFINELSQPVWEDYQWLVAPSPFTLSGATSTPFSDLVATLSGATSTLISGPGVTLSGATSTLTEIELTELRKGLAYCLWISNGPYQTELCSQRFDVAISPGRVATGVFAIVNFTLNNVSDSTMLISTTDFSVLDENLVSTQISLESTERYGKAILSDLGEDWTFYQPFVQIPTDPDIFMVFEDLEVRAVSNVRIRVVFDIPRTGVERKLKLRFRDDPPVDLVVGE